MNFTGKVVLITGASSGIGAATAVRFAELGASLSLTGRNQENLKKVASQCAAFFSNEPLTIVADLTEEKDVKRIVDTTINFFLTIDILINDAGILEQGSIENINMKHFDRIFNLNVRSVYHITGLAVPYLIQSQGSIVNVSSMNSMRSFPNLLSYNMSKAAIDQFTNCVALELASKQVRCNSVNPGVITTELHKRGGLTEKQYEDFVKHCQVTHPIGRTGTTEEVACAITFLASEKSGFITGVNLFIDGGRHLMCPR